MRLTFLDTSSAFARLSDDLDDLDEDDDEAEVDAEEAAGGVSSEDRMVTDER